MIKSEELCANEEMASTLFNYCVFSLKLFSLFTFLNCAIVINEIVYYIDKYKECFNYK